MKAPLYDQSGKKKGDVTLDKHIFEVEAAEGLIHQYLIYQQANARMPIAHVKNRSAVSGGGKKPFRQKGTGNARQGTTRAPQMRGGGRSFGPKNTRNFSKQMPKAMRRKALFSLLSSKAKDGMIMALDKYEAKEPKTKDIATLITKLPVERNVLLVVDREEKAMKMASRNIANGKTILYNYLNPADIMKYKAILFTEAALNNFQSTYKK
jgi:large subunit ribosomal protein L4